MELRQLQSFLAVVEEGQFAAAARRLYLSPPAVTGHIRALERELGTTLLSRNPLSLTRAGQRLLPHARAIMSAAESAADVASEQYRNREATIRVGVAAPGSGELTPAILQAFAKAHPRSHLAVQGLRCTEVLSSLLDHQVDVAFVRPNCQDERIHSDVLTIEPRLIIASAENELADADSLRLADILDQTFVGFPEGTPPMFAEYVHLTEARNGESARHSDDQPTTAQDLIMHVGVGHGIGVTLMSMPRYYSWPGVRFIPIEDASWEPTVLLSRRGDRRPEIVAFRALASMLARDLGPRFFPVSLTSSPVLVPDVP